MLQNNIDKLVSIFAPHLCLVCGDEPILLCGACNEQLQYQPSICSGCGQLSKGFSTCRRCRKHQPTEVIYIRTPYTQAARELVAKAKYERSYAAHKAMAVAVLGCLPEVFVDFTVVAVPTISPHVRSRGYDHVELMAKKIAKQLGLPYARLLERTINIQQVGKTRQERLKQLRGAVRANGKAPKRILLIDDVTTTGATLAECGRTLKRAGAKHVYAAVFARTPA